MESVPALLRPGGSRLGLLQLLLDVMEFAPAIGGAGQADDSPSEADEWGSDRLIPAENPHTASMMRFKMNISIQSGLKLERLLLQ